MCKFDVNMFLCWLCGFRPNAWMELSKKSTAKHSQLFWIVRIVEDNMGEDKIIFDGMGRELDDVFRDMLWRVSEWCGKDYTKGHWGL